VQNVSKSYERIFDEIFGEVGRGLDLGGDPDPLPLFCPNFYPLVMHFQRDSNARNNTGIS